MQTSLNIILSDPERQAYHEAGHAVLSFFGGRRIKSVSIGMCKITDTGFNIGETTYYKAVYHRLMDYSDGLHSKFAGAQAERIRCGGIYLRGIGGDLYNAIAEHEDFVVECRAHGVKEPSTLQDAWETAQRILDMNWYLVEAVAERLLEKGWLPGRSVRKIMHEAVKKRSVGDKLAQQTESVEAA